LASFGGPDEPWEGNSIPYREDTHEDGKAITAYLRDQWLGRGWVDVSSLLRDEIISRVVEIYDNAFSHARSPVGITSCGQHFPRLHELTLTAADFGVGIPSTVRAFLRRPDMSAAEAIRWALLSGTTTKPTDISRGLGLDLLKTFVKSHKGRLEIFSDGGRAVINEYVENYVDHDPSFEGTLVNIIIRCDETLYDETSVLTDGPLF
jgi:signal transduction histidine kinase